MLEKQKAPVVGGVKRRRGRRGDNIWKAIRHQKQGDLKDIGRISYIHLSLT